jgi:hypothetical protein
MDTSRKSEVTLTLASIFVAVFGLALDRTRETPSWVPSALYAVASLLFLWMLLHVTGIAWIRRLRFSLPVRLARKEAKRNGDAEMIDWEERFKSPEGQLDVMRQELKFAETKEAEHKRATQAWERMETELNAKIAKLSDEIERREARHKEAVAEANSRAAKEYQLRVYGRELMAFDPIGASEAAMVRKSIAELKAALGVAIEVAKKVWAEISEPAQTVGPGMPLHEVFVYIRRYEYDQLLHSFTRLDEELKTKTDARAAFVAAYKAYRVWRGCFMKLALMQASSASPDPLATVSSLPTWREAEARLMDQFAAKKDIAELEALLRAIRSWERFQEVEGDLSVAPLPTPTESTFSAAASRVVAS